ncbi:PTS glucitol/sorbitol transporter subunit IIA [Enterococcus ratti]|uniref:PTS system glucitol/sorbitol-specific transporter subunit IIA n=1 Tax=Enterococcus ratti TaxID=150033 RepID=A0A1L8WNP3_9ENTE|nr:PTS glucitol/sorbitol transporter subunit IIA [Enterococcus ratti]OJG82640.1 PTS system glucitol/sorbitol-specific transporter subunit IIA [Enterococcus ratti]
MIHATIKEIGKEAVSEKEPILILFDQTATSILRNYSVIQEITSNERFSLKKGGILSFDQQEYTIEHVGTMANENLNTVGHVTLIFDRYSKENSIANGIYLTPYHLPKIKIGTQIEYR